MKLLTGIALALTVAILGMRQMTTGESRSITGKVEHGKYLVHDVAQCVQCHSPRDGNGALLVDRLLTGAPIPVRSPFPDQEWAYRAPAIAGMPGYSEEDAIRLLTRGIARGGQSPRPPMLQFHMTEQDARDVFAYLKSLQ